RVWRSIQALHLTLYATPVDPAQPLDTSAGLNPAISADIRSAFSAAVADLVADGVPLNARLGDLQFFPKPDESIPQFGGEGSEGYFTVLRNSHLHVVDFPEDEIGRAHV